MCNCLDLKYAKKTHGHPYATQAAVDAAIAASGHVDQAAVDAAIAAAGHVDQAAVDAAIAAAGHIDQVALDAAVANLQAQIDTLEQALIDCGCLPEPCAGFSSDFSGVNLGGSTADSADWQLDTNALAWLRLERRFGEDQNCRVYVPINIVKQSGMTLDFLFDNQTHIDNTWVYLKHDSPVGVVSRNFYNPYNNPTVEAPYSLVDIDNGYEIIEAEFLVSAVDQSTTFARWLLEYVNIVCP